MWQVLRRFQGEEYDASGDGSLPASATCESMAERVSLSQRTIALHETKPYVDHERKVLKLTAPYGTMIYDKIVRYLKHEQVAMRQRALEMLLELYTQKPEHVTRSLDDGMLPAVVAAMGDAEEDVRAQACVAVQMIAQQEKGQVALLASADAFFPTFMKAIEDPSTRVVGEALTLMQSLHAASNSGACTSLLISLGLIPLLVRKIRSPVDSVCAAALTSLGAVFDIKEAFILVLDNGGMEAVTEALAQRQQQAILVEAAECAGKLAFYAAGKRAAVRCRTCAAVIPLLSHSDVAVRLACSGALVALSISEAGKLQCIESKVVSALHAALLKEEERDVLTNLVKTASNISEHPIARLQLHESVPRIQQVLEAAKADAENNGGLLRSAQRAIDMIHWQPGESY